MTTPSNARRLLLPPVATAVAMLAACLAGLVPTPASAQADATTHVAADSVALSDLDLSLLDQSWGVARRDRSSRGEPLRVAGRESARGIGTHSTSRLILKLDAGAGRFKAAVGVDDVAGDRASVRFSVRGDGKALWTSDVLKKGDPAVPVDIDVSGVRHLSLHVDDGGDGDADDHADWLDPVLTGATKPPAVVARLPDEEGWILPGRHWLDDRGRHVQAHGGGILKQGDTYYWFGEDRGTGPGYEPGKRYVACYSSTDLVNWTFRRQVVAIGSPFVKAPEKWWTIERPKVYHNKKTGKYVMYAHVEGGELRDYWRAEVAVFVSDTVDGEYKLVRHFRPLGKESRDIGQFVDDDGTAYLIFESRPTRRFFIAKLTDDYLDVERETCFIKSPLEGGALVKHDGLYYMIGSWMTGWNPNNNMYATAERLEGPWSEFKDIAPKEKKTYGSQSTLMLKVVGTERTSVIFMGDVWKPRTHWDGRYLWMPLEIGGGQLRLPEPRPWTIDVRTGVVTYK